MSEELAWGTLIVAALGTVFMGISALKAVAAAKLSRQELITCPNCGQPFNRTSFRSLTAEFPLTIDGKQFVTCPRCWYTYEV